MMVDINKKYSLLNTSEHVLKKDMWAGSSKITETIEWIIKDSQLELKEIAYPPSLYKCIDEAVVNALDHHINQQDTDEEVTWIKLGYDELTGEISVENNGAGIEIEIHKCGKYVPEMIFGTMFSGSNMEKAESSITGGTNGVGIKLANILSTRFTVETVRKAPNYHKYYKQTWTENMSKCGEPEIIDLILNPKKILAKKKLDHTLVTFIPDYKYFGYKGIKEAEKIIKLLMRTRAYMAGAYVGKLCKIYFNEEKIPVGSIDDLAHLIINDDSNILSTTIGKTSKWDISIIVAENDSRSKKNFCQLSIVNGVVVREGKHTEYLLEEIIKSVKGKISKELSNNKINFKPEFVYSNIILCVSCKIPGISWTGQTKEILNVQSRSVFSEYKLPTKFISELTSKLSEKIIEALCQDKKNIKKRIEYDKYYPANHLGKDSSLFLPEGDSAKGWCVKGLTSTGLGFDYYGILTTGGVTINVRKQMKQVKVLGTTKFTSNEKLSLNKFWNTFLGVTGLQPNYRYDPKSPTYQEEKALLEYGSIIGFVDQDHDGVGFIFSLILNMFELLWPNLLQEGYVKRFVTPLRRAYPKKGGKVYEFYNDVEFDEWAKQNDVSSYEIKYLKGLATHNENEIIYMFQKFQSNIFTYYMDDIITAHKTFEIYFGNDPELRKIELRYNPLEPPENILLKWQKENMLIDCTDHLIYEAKAHDLSNLYQKLWNAIDGMNESGRKILDGSQKKFNKLSHTIKVDQLAGYISEHENYHHAKASLEQSITGKAFLDVGGIQLPQLQPYGNFGSRAGGGDDAGQPRYIETKLNSSLVDLIYPELDKQLLEYTFDEGKRGEPKYYVPIIPMAILESVEMPAHGWKIKIYAREVMDVISNVKKMINEDNRDFKLDPIKYFTIGHIGDIKPINNKIYSFGKYKHDKKNNIITITELPLRVWTDNYFSKVIADPIIIPSRSKNHSGANGIEIILKLTSDAMEIINKKKNPIGDSIEDYFGLREYMDEQLNYIGNKSEVIEFKTVEEIIRYWFPFRKKLYAERIEREKLILKLKIKMLENVIRYIAENSKLSVLTGKTKKEAENYLAENNYDKFNKSKLKNLEYLPTNLLEHSICELGSYDYLLLTNDISRLDDAIKKRKDKLEQLKNKLDELITESQKGRFIGATIWLRELAELEKIINEGRKTGWIFDDKNKFKY